MTKTEEEFISTVDAAARCGTSRRAIHKLIRAGYLRPYRDTRDRRRRLVRVSDLDALFSPARYVPELPMITKAGA